MCVDSTTSFQRINVLRSNSEVSFEYGEGSESVGKIVGISTPLGFPNRLVSHKRNFASIQYHCRCISEEAKKIFFDNFLLMRKERNNFSSVLVCWKEH